MTWHRCDLKRDAILVANAITWCKHSLSSNGILWKHSWGKEPTDQEWTSFYFAQPQDLVMFKLMFG